MRPDPTADAGADAGRTPDVSVIIVHYRTPDLLARCLETIAAAAPAVVCETLVVDNAPLDEQARTLADRHGAGYLPSDRNLGYARGANLGMEAARGRYHLILNPDIEVQPGSIEALVAFMDAHPDVGLCGPKLFSPDGSLQYSARTNYTLKIILLRRTPLGRLFPRARALRDHLMLDWDHNDVRDVDWMLGGAVLARQEALQDVGGMDPRYFLYFEDVDWCERMRGRGWRVVYVPDAQMIHAHRRLSARGFFGHSQRRHIESALRFYEKWSMVLYLWKQNTTTLRALATLLLDIVLLSAAFYAAYFTRYALGLLVPGWGTAKPLLALGVYSRFVFFADVVAVAMFYFLRLYRGEVWHHPWREFFQLTKGVAITSLVVLASTFLFARRPLSRFTIVLFFPYALLLVSLGRDLLRRLVAGARERQLYLRRLAIFAPQSRIEETKERFARHGTFGYEPIFLAHEEERLRPRATHRDPVERRIELLAHERIAEVVVFEGTEDAELVRALMPRLLRSGLPLRYVPFAERQIRGGRRLDDFMGFTAVALGGRPPAVGGWLKRLLDLLLAMLLIVLGAPPHLWQVLVGGRPVFVRHPAIGRKGEVLELRAYRRPSGFLRVVPGMRHYPALGQILSGRLSFVGIVPLQMEEWAAAGEDYRENPPDAPPGLITPLPGRSAGGLPSAEAGTELAPERQELVARILTLNREYVDRWSLSEDIRLVLELLLGTTARRGRES